MPCRVGQQGRQNGLELEGFSPICMCECMYVRTYVRMQVRRYLYTYIHIHTPSKKRLLAFEQNRRSAPLISHSAAPPSSGSYNVHAAHCSSCRPDRALEGERFHSPAHTRS